MADHGHPDIAAATGTVQTGPEQADPAQAGTAQPGMTASPHPGAVATVDAPPVHHGRPISWTAVSIIMIGFVAGGFGLVFGPLWWLFWAGCACVALGGIVALAGGIFNDWY